MKRLNVLLSTYACQPGQGSEPGIGWNVARKMAEHHNVWVLTYSENRPHIEAEMVHRPNPNLHFVYCDCWPWSWMRSSGRPKSKPAVEAHYYLWQISAYFRARRLIRKVDFDLVHHVTYLRYWTPSLMALLPLPFILGPVGGAETAPRSFWADAGGRAWILERLRDAAQWLGEHDPLVRLGTRRSRVALATTEQTAARLRHLQAPRVEVRRMCGLSHTEIEQLGRLAPPPVRPLRFCSIGRLLHWKGFHLGLRAFAEAGCRDAEYWIVGDGPWRQQLEHEARSLGIGDRVRFWGWLPREEALNKLAASHIFVHPSLHDSDGWACLEAMAARRPVLCLDTGGPSYQVTPDTGIKVPVRSPNQVVRELAAAMLHLSSDMPHRNQMGKAGHRRVKEMFSWDHRVASLLNVYESTIRQPEPMFRREESVSYAS